MNVSQLIDGLNSLQAGERAEAAERLAMAGHDARAAAVSLVRAAGDESDEVSSWSVSALEQLGPPAVADQATLAELLGSRREGTAYWAATLLGRLVSLAEPSSAALARTALLHPQMPVRQRAVWALGQTNSSSPTTLQALRRSAQSPDARLARLAQRALQQVGG